MIPTPVKIGKANNNTILNNKKMLSIEGHLGSQTTRGMTPSSGNVLPIDILSDMLIQVLTRGKKMSWGIQRELIGRKTINLNPDQTQQRGGLSVLASRSSRSVRSHNLHWRTICQKRVSMSVSTCLHKTMKPMKKPTQVKNNGKFERMSTKLC